jgi:hypothetical protein
LEEGGIPDTNDYQILRNSTVFNLREEVAMPLDEDHWEYLPKQSFVVHLRGNMRLDS